MVGEVLDDITWSDVVERDVVGGMLLTVPAYPALRKPVPPSRTVATRQRPSDCLGGEDPYQLALPPCWVV